MPAVAYLPSTDTGLLTWANAFSAQITATPTAFGLVAGQATTLAGFTSAYATALGVATNESTRTKSTVAAKNTAKANLLFNIRLLVAIIQGFPTITDAQLEALGLTVRSTTRAPVPAPATSPILSILGIVNRNLRLAIADELTPAKRGRPALTTGMELYYQVAGTVPVSTTGMTFLGVITRSPTQLALPDAALGKVVYLIGRWINGKGNPGPDSALVSAVCS